MEGTLQCRVMGEHEAEVLEAAIPPSLWRVLRCIFDLGTANALQIAERLGTRYGVDVHPKTAGVLLLRLTERGLIRAEPVTFGRGRPSHLYTATLTKEGALRGQVEAFLRQYRIEEDSELEVLEGVIRERRAAMGGPPLVAS